MRRRLFTALVLILALLPAAYTIAQAACTPADSVTPAAAGTLGDDPSTPTYCVSPQPSAQTATRVNGTNDWVDNFGITGLGRFIDGDMGYKVFDGIAGIKQSEHMVIGDHWIDDNQQQYGGGALISPNRTFTFESGKMVVEADFSAGEPDYAGNAWGEFIITPAASPDINPPYAPEQEYAYGRFHGYPAFGCRIQDGDFVCAGFNGIGVPFTPTADRPPCFSLDDGGISDPTHYGIRLWELSFFQQCGSEFQGGVHYGGSRDAVTNGSTLFRRCVNTSVYDDCLDRFRLELTASSMVWYVNGTRFFEDSGWDTNHQLTALLAASSVHVYFADWNFNSTVNAYRFHWERLAVNPHKADGSFTDPSASPSFGPPNPTPTPTPTPVPSNILLGNNVVESQDDSNAVGTAQEFPYTSAATGVTSTGVHEYIYLSDVQSSTNITVGVYNSSRSLLGQCSISSPVVGWNSCSLSPTITIQPATLYYLAELQPTGQTNRIQFRDRSSFGNVSDTSSSSTLSTLPSTWVVGTSWSSGPASMYVQ